MKKRYIRYGIGILLISLLAGGLVWIQAGRVQNMSEGTSLGAVTQGGISQRYPDKIPVVSWNGLDTDKMYRICDTKIKSDFYNNMSECDTSFKSDVSLEEMIGTNKDDYLGMFTYYTGKCKVKGALFFKDDSYYLLSYDANWDIFTAECCYSDYTFDHYSTYIPTPVDLHIAPDMIDAVDELGYYELDVLFNNYTFDGFCQFYERMSPKLYKIDKGKQRITLSGYDLKKKKMRYRFITFDFKNQSIIGPDKKGKAITIKEHKQPSPSTK